LQDELNFVASLSYLCFRLNVNLTSCSIDKRVGARTTSASFRGWLEDNQASIIKNVPLASRTTFRGIAFYLCFRLNVNLTSCSIDQHVVAFRRPRVSARTTSASFRERLEEDRQVLLIIYRLRDELDFVASLSYL